MRNEFEILAIRAVGDPEIDLYPKVINDGKALELVKHDVGVQTTAHAVRAMSFVQIGDKWENMRNLPSQGHLHSIFLTKTRLLLLNHQYKHADASDLVAGMPGFYLAGTVYSKLRTRNRALVAMLPYHTIKRVSVKGSGSSFEENSLRASIDYRTTDQRIQNMFLQIDLKRGTDPRPIAHSLFVGVCQAWLTHRLLEQAPYARLEALTSTAMLTPEKNAWAAYNLPCWMPLGAPKA